MLVTFEGARLVDAQGDRRNCRLVVEDGWIAAVGQDIQPRGQTIDVAGMVMTPGFIDLHTHGGGGFKLHTTDPDEIQNYARWAVTTGTTAFLTGVVGVPGEPPLPQLRAATRAIPDAPTGSELLGIHLEGPYINATRRGAHDPAWLRLPNPDETERVLAAAQGQLRLVTLAPELPGAARMIQQLVQAGVRVSIGHTDASYDQTREAIGLGASHATHCFNAMRPLHHRDPGPVAAIVEAAEVTGELIADGVHVHPAAMRFLTRALGPERTVIITDAQPVAGLPGGTFNFAGQPASVVDGAARLADGTLAGSVLTMDQALRNLIAWSDLDLPDVIAMLTYNPARVAGVAARKGLLHVGYDADVLLLDEQLSLQATFRRGRLAYATDTWKPRLA